MIRRVDVHRCPAVPTAPNTMARSASSMICMRGDNDGIVPAEFQDGSAKPFTDQVCLPVCRSLLIR